MPRFGRNRLDGYLGGHGEAFDFAYDTRAPELRAALGGLGLGEVKPRGLGDDQARRDIVGSSDTLDMIASQEVRAAFEQNIAASGMLYERIGVIAPTIAELVLGGIDFTDLASIYQAEDDARYTPELVLAPVDLPLSRAKNLFLGLCRDANIPNNRLEKNGLFVAGQVADNWARLTGPSVLPNARLIASVAEDRLWSLRIMPGTPYAVETGVNHAGEDKNGLPAVSPDHPTILEYLTVQALRIQAGNKLLDAREQGETWLAGKFEYGGNVRAACGGFSDGEVRLRYGTIHNTRTSGIRPMKGSTLRA